MPGRLMVSIAATLILASAGLSGNVSAQRSPCYLRYRPGGSWRAPTVVRQSGVSEDVS